MTSSVRLAKAKVAGSNPVFRSKLPGFRDVGGSGLFHERRLARRRRRFTLVPLEQLLSNSDWELASRGSWLFGGVAASSGLEQGWNIALGEGALGVSQAAVSREKYIEITLEYTLAVARAAWAQNPALRFCFLSGCAADREERALSLYGKIKGRTERELAKLNPNLFCFRPAVIKPSRRGEKTPIGATLFTPVTWLVDRLTDGFSVETAVLARCMIDVAKNGAGEAIFDKSRNSQLAEPLNGALVGYA